MSENLVEPPLLWPLSFFSDIGGDVYAFLYFFSDLMILQKSSMMELRSHSQIWYQRAEKILYHSTIAIFVYFAAYIMCRHTSYLTPFVEEPYNTCFTRALAASVVAFFLSSLLMYCSPDSSNDIAPVITTATLTSAGTFSGVYGHMPLMAGILSAVFAILVIKQGPYSFVDPFIGFISGILSSITSSIAVGRQPDFNDNLLKSMFAGVMAVFIPILSAYFIGHTLTVIFRAHPLGLKSIVMFTGVGAGTAAQICDRLALEVVHKAKVGVIDIPQDFLEGLAVGLCIGLSVGVQIGYSKYYDRNYRSASKFRV